MAKSIFVWDPNPFNCYGAEVARVIGHEFEVYRFARYGDRIRSPHVKNVNLLPAPASGRRDLWTAIRYLAGLVIFCLAAVLSRTPVVVTWMNTAAERRAIRILQITGCRTVVVVHNPVKGRDEAETQSDVAKIRRHASGLVVHEKSLASGLNAHRRVYVAAHPAYLAWANATSTSDVPTRPQRVALFLGSARHDKGFDQLPKIASELESLEFRLHCAIGRLTGSDAATLDGIPNIDILHAVGSHISNKDVRSAIDGSSVLIAPYNNVTASGTILMAISVGLPVAAYHNPGLDGLIPSNYLAKPATPKELVTCAYRASQCDPTDMQYRARLHDELASQQWIAMVNDLFASGTHVAGSVFDGGGRIVRHQI